MKASIKKFASTIFIVLLLISQVKQAYCQEKTHSLSFILSIDEALQKDFKSEGRLFLFFDKYPDIEPRTEGLGYGYCCFAKNYEHWNANESITINSTKEWDKYQSENFLIADAPETGWYIQEKWEITNVPEGIYYLQFLWDQNTEESRINSQGNLYSKTQKIEVKRSMKIETTLSEVIPPLILLEHELIKGIKLQSDTLSKYWGDPVILKASVLLPSEYYQHPNKAYPIRYDIAGYGGRYTRLNNYMEDKNFSKWWLSGEAPQIINVYLDGEGPYGDCYQIDSEAGPYGYALIHELIPFIEAKYRGTQSPVTRFVSGCSTGGWVSLALQLFYPDIFNGVFSYSPDPVDFSQFLLIDIYKDKNFYFNEYSYPQQLFRTIYGEIVLTWKDFINFERVISPTGHFTESREMTGAFNGLFSPKGEDRLSIPLFDEVTGKIDPKVAEHWKKYDLLLYTKENWKELGPKLKGKIYIWMGDMDNFYLNPALRNYEKFLKSTENPKSDAVIEFVPMKGHCEGATQRNRIEKVAGRLFKLDEDQGK